MWKREKQLEQFSCRVFTVYEEQYLSGDNQTITRYTVRHPGAAVFLPITERGTVLLVKQFRAPIDDFILEAPAGTLEAGEDPLECAKREIQEEVGVKSESWQKLGTLYPAPGFCDELQHLFVARNLSPSKLPADEDEEIEVVELSLSEVKQRIRSGEISDAKTVSLYVRLCMLGDKKT